MNIKRIIGMSIVSMVLVFGSAVSAYATSAPATDSIVVNTAASKAYQASLTVHLSKPVSASVASQIRSTLEGAIHPDAAGPTRGAFLVCNKAHIFSDSDGTFSIQHRCYGTTGPWGYRISTGVCSFTVSDVHETGMAWTRNGKRQGTQSPHTEYCRYQFHGNFNPEHDFDLIAYNDHFDFTIEVGGQRGSADLHIYGSFYSAVCSNPSVCPG